MKRLLFPCGLVLFFWGVVLFGSRFLSLSMDEPLHIAAGYAFLARGVSSLWHLSYYIQPPLPGILEASLLYLANPNVPVEGLSGWGTNYVEFTASFMPYLFPMERTEVIGRLPVMLAGALTLALTFRWATDLFRSRKGGTLALLILALDPLFRAHSRFATTDTLATLMGLSVGYVTWRWLQTGSWHLTLCMGLCLGLALVTKFSAVLYVLAWLLVFFWMLLKTRSSKGKLLVQATVSLTIALWITWAMFGWEMGHIPGIAVPAPVPAPRYWRTLLDVDQSAHQRVFIAFGQLFFGSQWWYFPLNFVIKNPLPWLAAVFLGVGKLLGSRPRWDYLVPVAAVPLVYAASAVWRGMNVSYRHMLPVHPFLAMLAAYGIWQTLKKKPVWRPLALWIPLGLWYAGGTLAIFPDELAYFNELVGGPAGAPRYLVDYTQDWGQSMKQLRAYLDAHPGPEPYIVYYNTHLRPEHYGIRYRSLAPSPGAMYQVTALRPQPGRYAIGVAPLYGLVGRDRMELEWFRRATPQAMVGHAYYIYEVQERSQWLFQCPSSSPPLNDSAIAWGFGPVDLRKGAFDCTEGWIYPAGKTPGVYALHGHMLEQPGTLLPPSLRPPPVPKDGFARRHLANTRLAYYQPFFGLLPAFALYEQGSGLPQERYQLATAGQTASGGPLQAPVVLVGPLTFLGANVFWEESCLDIETWWRATDGPVTRPLSIMGHLLNGAGEVIGQDDGLGASPVLWQPGDIIVQRHRFPLPPKGEELWLRTGVYWLDTMERWPLADQPDSDIMLIQLPGTR